MARGGFRIQAKVNGLDDVMKTLAKLKQSTRTKILRKAVTQGAKPILKDARSKAPVESGLLKKSLGTKIKTYPSGVVVAVIGPRMEFKTDPKTSKRKQVYKRTGKAKLKRFERRQPAYYAHLVEKGTKPHSLGKGSSTRKKTQVQGPQHPGTKAVKFMRRALDSQQASVRVIMRKVIRQELEKEAKRLARRQGQRLVRRGRASLMQLVRRGGR